MRRESVETAPDGSRVLRTERLTKWAGTLPIGDKTLSCRVFEKTVIWKTGRTTEKLWISDAVPGRVVKRVRKSVNRGETSTETASVVAFGLR